MSRISSAHVEAVHQERRRPPLPSGDAPGIFSCAGQRRVSSHRIQFPVGPDELRGVDLWNVWGKLDCSTLVLHGAESEVLLAKTVAEMRERRPDVEIVEFPGVGHAPALMSDDQIAVVKAFLLR